MRSGKGQLRARARSPSPATLTRSTSSAKRLDIAQTALPGQVRIARASEWSAPGGAEREMQRELGRNAAGRRRRIPFIPACPGADRPMEAHRSPASWVPTPVDRPRPTPGAAGDVFRKHLLPATLGQMAPHI